MKYVECLLEETDYLQMVEKLEKRERNRIFCRHGLSHLLDVARIGWILALERGQAGREKPGEALKEKIYLTALLHDLGRLAEAEEGTPHHRAGAALAGELLDEIQYPKEEQQDILAAISEHRGEGNSLTSDKECRGEGNSLTSDKECRGEQQDIFGSGTKSVKGEKLNRDFIHLIKEADNRSRNCFFCSSQALCNWSKERRNQGIFW
ncbi:MAG: HD domain-containing protein [Lachnospiraceae bacterium]|nr:HD domain-containing protein [Lachnospiraceae bacterium]